MKYMQRLSFLVVVALMISSCTKRPTHPKRGPKLGPKPGYPFLNIREPFKLKGPIGKPKESVLLVDGEACMETSDFSTMLTSIGLVVDSEAAMKEAARERQSLLRRIDSTFKINNLDPNSDERDTIRQTLPPIIPKQYAKGRKVDLALNTSTLKYRNFQLGELSISDEELKQVRESFQKGISAQLRSDKRFGATATLSPYTGQSDFTRHSNKIYVKMGDTLVLASQPIDNSAQTVTISESTRSARSYSYQFMLNDRFVQGLMGMRVAFAGAGLVQKIDLNCHRTQPKPERQGGAGPSDNQETDDDFRKRMENKVRKSLKKYADRPHKLRKKTGTVLPVHTLRPTHYLPSFTPDYQTQPIELVPTLTVIVEAIASSDRDAHSEKRYLYIPTRKDDKRPYLPERGPAKLSPDRESPQQAPNLPITEQMERSKSNQSEEVGATEK